MEEEKIKTLQSTEVGKMSSMRKSTEFMWFCLKSKHEGKADVCTTLGWDLINQKECLSPTLNPHNRIYEAQLEDLTTNFGRTCRLKRGVQKCSRFNLLLEDSQIESHRHHIACS